MTKNNKSKIRILLMNHKETLCVYVILITLAIICEPNRVGIIMAVSLAITCLIMIIGCEISDLEDKLGKKYEN